MKSKPYRAVDVNRLDMDDLCQQHPKQAVHVGLDIGKELIYCVLRWARQDYDRPWKVKNPFDIRLLAQQLKQLGQDREMIIALEPTGTYGDPLRDQLRRMELPVHRVSPVASARHAETFDGVPSQHDGKDAAVIADLASQGRSWLWPQNPASPLEAELAYLVDKCDLARRQKLVHLGRLEGLLARHWPEATRHLPLGRATLLRCLHRYGGPAALAADTAGAQRLQRWGRARLAAAKAQALFASAKETVGVEQGAWETLKIQDAAGAALGYRETIRQCERRLGQLAIAHPILQAQAEVVGLTTSCVLWVHLGDPRHYDCGCSYRKAMGLNLAEHSSGKWKGQLHITKRGASAVRRWLYFSALRWVQREPIQRWYEQQQVQHRGQKKVVIVALMRKLALAAYQVGGRGQSFCADRLVELSQASQ